MARVHKMESLWQGRVGEEVETIRSLHEERRQEDIHKAWNSNRSACHGLHTS